MNSLLNTISIQHNEGDFSSVTLTVDQANHQRFYNELHPILFWAMGGSATLFHHGTVTCAHYEVDWKVANDLDCDLLEGKYPYLTRLNDH